MADTACRVKYITAMRFKAPIKVLPLLTLELINLTCMLDESDQSKLAIRSLDGPRPKFQKEVRTDYLSEGYPSLLADT
jgi:hypothetical protein